MNSMPPRKGQKQSKDCARFVPQGLLLVGTKRAILGIPGKPWQPWALGAGDGETCRILIRRVAEAGTSLGVARTDGPASLEPDDSADPARPPHWPRKRRGSGDGDQSDGS